MKQARVYESIKASQHSSEKIEDSLVVEAPLQININGEPYTVVMRTPGDDFELALGLLYAEDIYRNETTPSITVNPSSKKDNNILDVEISADAIGKGYLNKRTLLSVSSCGICGKKEISDLHVKGSKIKNTYQLNMEKILQMTNVMYGKQALFRVSGGSHACAIFDSYNNLLTCKEDIGRHNAVDKCVGSLLHQNKLRMAKIMLVSGRVSYEIVSKAFFAKIPIIIAVSACSSLAVDFAKEFGICLIGFNRNNKVTIYANPQYLQL